MAYFTKQVNVGGGFEVHVGLSDDLICNIQHLKDLVNQSLGGMGIHACMTRHGSVVHLSTSGLTPWSKVVADLVLEKVSECLPSFHVDTSFKKRIRQVRDALNKCQNAKKIEQIAAILEI